jgi:serine/threonine protein kinase
LAGAINRTKALRGHHVKITDFDFLCREASVMDFLCPQGTPEPATVVGTDGYIAPEAYKGKASSKSDVFSSGVVMYGLVTGKFPFPDSVFAASTGDRIYEKFRRAHLAVKWDQEVWDEMPAARAFCQKLLAFHVLDRPSSQEALEEDWLRGVGKKATLRKRSTIS